jgi:hypothetical protein
VYVVVCTSIFIHGWEIRFSRFGTPEPPTAETSQFEIAFSQKREKK